MRCLFLFPAASFPAAPAAVRRPPAVAPPATPSGAGGDAPALGRGAPRAGQVQRGRPAGRGAGGARPEPSRLRRLRRGRGGRPARSRPAGARPARRRERALMRLSAALAALSIALPASAYKRAQVNGTGPLLFWATRAHSYQIDSRGTPDLTDGSEFDAVRRSLAAWAAASCSDLKFNEDPPAQTDRR